MLPYSVSELCPPADDHQAVVVCAKLHLQFKSTAWCSGARTKHVNTVRSHCTELKLMNRRVGIQGIMPVPGMCDVCVERRYAGTCSTSVE